MNIRNKLLLIFMLVSGTSLGLLTTLAINNFTDLIQREVESSLNSIVDEKVTLIYSYIDSWEKTVSTYANMPFVIELIPPLTDAYNLGVDSLEYQKYDNHIRSSMRQLNDSIDGDNLFLIAPSGEIIFSLKHEIDLATNLKNGPFQSSQLAHVFRRASSFLETQISQFRPYSPSQYQLLKELHTSGIMVSKKTDHEALSAFVAAPIFRNDSLLGVLAIQLKGDDYFKLTTDYSGLKSTGDTLISQKSGNQVRNIAPLRDQPNSAHQYSFRLGSEKGIPIQRSVSGEKGSGLSVGFDDKSILAAWRYIPELRWGVVVRINSDEAFFEATTLRQKLIYLSLVVLLISIVVAIYSSHTIAAPLMVLAKASGKIAEGDFSQRVQIRGTDEIANLGTAFNHMSSKLNKVVTNLENSNKALELSNRELDNFAYVASHDLKSPLRGIDQLATWIWEDIDDKDETIDHLQMMRSRVSRMECLLDDLLAYSRVGRVEQKIGTINSKYLLESLFELVSPPDSFTFELKGEFPVFDTISAAFELVFRNLISNAIKHHDRDDGRIIISIEENDSNYIFEVTDDGPGIAEKFHKKIFGLFQTLKSRDEIEGSGMGLAILQKTLKLYDGNIVVQSEEGKGACFVVTWPKKIEQTTYMDV